ncbi:MAG: sugar O-acetyltransferase [Bacteroides sp.]|nr:sugar O-acetyltransferase [Bacteroides sp.]
MKHQITGEPISPIWKKMIDGERYDATHPELIDRLMYTRKLLHEFNNLAPDRRGDMEPLIEKLFGKIGEGWQINQPLHVDYGCNMSIGRNFFANFNLTVLDEALVMIGDNVFFGPNVSIYTACHPLSAAERNELTEWAEPVTIGDDVWIGGSATICPGVNIGNRAVIGAGSVVTRDIPDDSLAVGNPAHVIRRLNDNK